MLLMHLHQFDISGTQIQERVFLSSLGTGTFWKDMETGQKYVKLQHARIFQKPGEIKFIFIENNMYAWEGHVFSKIKQATTISITWIKIIQ